MIILVLLATLLAGSMQSNIDPEVDAFLAGYLPARYPPAMCDNMVMVGIDLVQIGGVNEKEETVTVTIQMSMAYFLDNGADVAWNTFSTPIPHFFPKPGTIWRPDISFLNSVGTEKEDSVEIVLGPNPMTPCTEADPKFVPAVMFSRMSTEVISCSLDLESFPFDEQTCSIDIGPCFTSTEAGNYIISDAGNADEMPLANYMANAQWDMLETKIIRGVRPQARKMSSVELQTLSYRFKIKRSPIFYVYTLLIPCSLLAIISILCVIIPCESGEKISLAITIMLSQIVNLLILSTLIPASSTNFPRIGIFSVTTIFLIVAVLIYCCIEISMFNHQFTKSPPRVVIKICTGFLGPVLCVDSGDVGRRQKQVSAQMANKASKMEETLNEIHATIKAMNEIMTERL
jgi:nicotinic acetylcholine receptor